MTDSAAADGRVAVAVFDHADAAQAAEMIAPCCASLSWVEQLVRDRPHHSVEAITVASDAAVADLQWPDIEQALAAHPRIGERAQGADRESAWSRQEQSAAATPGTTTQDALLAGNLDYEQRFGHVFLICATGKSAEDVLAALTARLNNRPDTERDIVRRELRQIVRLRLAKTLR